MNDRNEQNPRAEQELRDIKHALDEAAIVAITDAAGVITYVNDKFCALSQYTRDELLGKTHRIINSGHHPKGFMKHLWETIDAGQVWKGDIKNKAKDGTFYWVATTIVPFLDDEGRPYQHLAIRHEITERILAEQRLIEEQAKIVQAEKLSSLGLLCAGVAHEVNNPLTGVMACVRALEGGNLSEAQQAQYLDAVRDGVARIQGIVEGLLDYARPQSVRQQVDVAKVVASCLLLLTSTLRKKKLEVEMNVPTGRMVTMGDRAQLTQAAMNVLLNAVHASPERAMISIDPVERDGYIGVAFTDNGPGIPAEFVSRVCDPFFTTKPVGEGTGLGLAVTQGILQAHDGELEVESEVGTGTTVRFWLRESLEGYASADVESSSR